MHLAESAAPYADFTEIIEMHHKHKIDSPSGTALVLGETIAKSRNVNFNKNKES